MFADFRDSIMRDRRRAITVGGIVVLVIIIAVISRGDNKSRELLKVVKKFESAPTLHASAELELDLPVQLRTADRPIVGITARVEGDIDKTGDTMQLAGDVYTEARGRGMILFADGEIRMFENEISFNLENLPALLNPQGTLVERWTRVEAPLLTTNNSDNVRDALAAVFSSMDYQGKEMLPGTEDKDAKHYTRLFTAEEEDQLTQVFRIDVSGNQGLHVVARLLRPFDVRSFDVWTVDGDLRLIEATFAKEADEDPRGRLTLKFDEYGKTVVIEDAPQDLKVDADVFAAIFGRGEIEEL